MSVWSIILSALVFLIVNAVVLYLILVLNRREGAKKPATAAPPAAAARGELPLSPGDVLGWEFEYARVTASEAMEQRHTLVNFYLLVAGVVGSGVLAFLSGTTGSLRGAGTALLWLLCGIGWVYFLSIIRLRQAWHDSARAMNQIKEFCIQNAQGFEPEALRQAFRWQAHTLPAPDKPWTVFFYSAMLIALLDSVAFVAGGMLLDWDAGRPLPLPALGPLAVLGLVFFAYHVWLYFAFLRPASR